MNRMIAIIGAGGFAREVAACIKKPYSFFVSDHQYKGENNIKPLSKFRIDKYDACVAIGDPITRTKIVDNLPKNTNFLTFVHPSAQLLDNNIDIGHGSIICAGSIITTNVKIGKHSHINLNSTIGHDCHIGDFFTCAPDVNVSGNCDIGDLVYIGTNAVVREKIKICSNVVIGLNSGIVKNIVESGIYVGTPAKRIK